MTESTADAPLYILGAHVEQFMGVEFAELTFGPDAVTQITGPNGNGKTDVLNALWAALLGEKYAPEMPVQAGAERAETTVTLGDAAGKPMFVAKRVYHEGGTSTLELRGADGVKFASPQTMLNAFIDTLFFNPCKFADPGQRTEAANNDARKEILFELCPLIGSDGKPFDLAAHDTNTKTLADERAAVKKRAKALEAVVQDAIAGGVLDGPKEDETALVTQIAQAENAGTLRAAAAKRNAELEREVKEIEAEIVKLREKADRLAVEWQKQGQAAMPPKDAPDLAVLKSDLAARRDRNTKRDAAIGDRARAEERAKTLQAERSRETVLDGMLAKRDEERAAAIAAAKFPIPSLTINSEGWLAVKKKEGGVIPFHQESKARRILAGFVILASKRSRLRNCIIPSGNDLDGESMLILRKQATRFGIRVILERIIGDPAAGPVIEFMNGRPVPGAAS